MPGARGTLAARVADVDPGVEALGIHLLGRGREHEVDPGLLGERGVALFVARIAREVLGRAELRGVDEQRHDDRVALSTRGAKKRVPD